MEKMNTQAQRRRHLRKIHEAHIDRVAYTIYSIWSKYANADWNKALEVFAHLERTYGYALMYRAFGQEAVNSWLEEIYG